MDDDQRWPSAFQYEALILFSSFAHQLHPWEPLLDLHFVKIKEATDDRCPNNAEATHANTHADRHQSQTGRISESNGAPGRNRKIDP